MKKGFPEISQKLSEPLNISETQKRMKKREASMNKKFIFICILAILVFSMGVIANEPIIDLELVVYKNDNVDEHYVHLTDGLPSISYKSGDYRLVAVNNQGTELFSKSIDFVFKYSGLVSYGYDYSGLVANSQIFNFDIPYSPSMHELRLYHGEKLIFSKVLNFCNNDSICNITSETYESCPADCPLDHNDLICIFESDGVCDPDCWQDVDPDCVQEFYPYAGPNKEAFVGEPVSFHGEVTNPGTGTYTYEWSIEAFSDTKKGQDITYVFEEDGHFAIDLIVTNQEGIYKKDTFMIKVIEPDYEEKFHTNISTEQPEQQKKESIIDKILSLWKKITNLFGK